MDPVTLIVTALALGAVAGLKPTAEQAVKDAYSGLKRLIIDRYQAAQPGVALIESNPQSETFQAAATEQLQVTAAAQDEELISQAQALTELIQQYAPEAAAEINVKLSDIEAIGNFRVSDLAANGDKAKIDVDIEKVKAGQDFEVSGLRATGGEEPESKK